MPANLIQMLYFPGQTPRGWLLSAPTQLQQPQNLTFMELTSSSVV